MGIAQLLNIVVYNAGWLNGQTFDMFYISPYFISSLPVFDTIDRNASFAVFMLTYLFAFFLGGGLVAFAQGARDRLSKALQTKARVKIHFCLHKTIELFTNLPLHYMMGVCLLAVHRLIHADRKGGT